MCWSAASDIFELIVGEGEFLGEEKDPGKTKQTNKMPTVLIIQMNISVFIWSCPYAYMRCMTKSHLL